MSSALVLITGTGRSGTSTMSGTLHHLGLRVPGPYLGANESNPKGFFESRWSVRFHSDLTERAGIHIFDNRPDATARVQRVVTGRDRNRLASFFDRKLVGHDQTVVKDPRTVWTQRLWAEVAATRDVELRYVSMLRHPAEVVGSRITYYSGRGIVQPADAEQGRRRYAILNLARWINVSLVNERQTRGLDRAFVRYTDLLDDWRAVATSLQADLGLRYGIDVASGEPCAVDDFIDAGLRRHGVAWDELSVPEDLQRLAQQVWDQLQVVADAHGRSGQASAALDLLAEEYADLLVTAEALDADLRDDDVRAAREQGAADALADAAAAVEASRSVDDIGGRELLRIAARRAAGRLRR